MPSRTRKTPSDKRRSDAANAKKYRVRYRLVFVRGEAPRNVGDRINPDPKSMGYFDHSTDSLIEASVFIESANRKEQVRAEAIKRPSDHVGSPYWRKEFSVYENVGRDEEGLTIEVAVIGPDKASPSLSKAASKVVHPFVAPVVASAKIKAKAAANEASCSA